MSTSPKSSLPPPNFCSAMERFITDIQKPFPELTPIIGRWWKDKSHFVDDLNDTEFTKSREVSMKLLYTHCQQVYLPNIQTIMNKMFPTNSSEVNADICFLPNIHFRALFESQISPATKEALWNYIMLIACSLESNDNRDLINSIVSQMFNSTDKSESTQSPAASIETIFETLNSLPNPTTSDNIDPFMNSFMNTKLGALSKTIADNALKSIPIPTRNPAEPKKTAEEETAEQFEHIMKNPDIMMNIMKDAKQSLDESMASGELTQEELMGEVNEMFKTMGGFSGLGKMAGNDILKTMMSQMVPEVVPSSAPLKEDTQKFQSMREKLQKAAANKESRSRAP